MADVYWLGTDGNLANTANYSTGALPQNGDNLWFQQSSSAIATNLTALAGIQLANIYVTPGFSGTGGLNANSADAILLSAGTPNIVYNGTNCGRYVFDFGTGYYTVTITGSPTGGTFTITVGGQTTAGIAYNATAAAVQSAVALLSTVGSGNVTVTGSAGGPYTLYFDNHLGYSLTVSASGAGLTGGTSPNASASGTAAINYTMTVLGTGTSADTNLESLRIRGGGTGSKLYVVSGTVGVCTSRPGLVAQLSEFDVSGTGSGSATFSSTTGGTLNLGYGVTWSNGFQNGGTLTTSTGTSGTLKQLSGTLTTQGTGKITQLDIGGNATLNHRPTAGAATDTLIVQSSGVADWSKNPQAFSITNQVKLYSGASLYSFSQANSTWTGGIDCIECGLENVTLKIGKGLLLTVAAG